jgi:protein Mpv17
VTYSILNTPINCYWQDFLEASFPSNVPANIEVPNKQEKTTTLETKQVLSIKNTLIKFFMDQTIGAAFNIPLFIGIIGMVKGQSVETITNNIKAVSRRDEIRLIWHANGLCQDFLDVYLSGMKLWPAVSLISFTVIPADRRVIFGSLAGVAWNIYLSLKAR